MNGITRKSEIILYQTEDGKTKLEVRPSDVTIAKNYLNAEEMGQLNRIVTMYLDYAEDQARRHRQIFMRDW